VGAHLILLHTEGSSSPLGVTTGVDKVRFHPYFTRKDLVGVVLSFTLLIVLCCVAPYLIRDPDNFIEANPMVTPVHIKPEWYFLFAYGILRSVPSKLGGVVALVIAVLMLYLLPFNSILVTSLSNNPTLKRRY
jgi:ubiquinol-cytochrome c reductase cytochrome b subunit